ncbi:uncharacterized protein LOC141670600 [Apium graveolens]|uniref:uncharacterized protein LOC141670600 n=1 Tax=Apium graveolens TaxID=4045 RepID=UPI003D798C42
MSTSRLYAKGIHRFLFLLMYFFFAFCLSCFLLTWIEPFFIIVEFKPLFFSSHNLFKRARDEKSTKIESSKAPLAFSPVSSTPAMKKVRIESSAIKTDAFTPLAIQNYDVAADPSTFAHMLGDMLLPQSMKTLSAKPIESIMSDAAGYSFHTLQRMMVAREVLNHDMKRLKEIEDEHMKCASRIHVAEELALNNLKSMKDVQNELDDFASKVQSLEKDMRDDVEKVVCGQG